MCLGFDLVLSLVLGFVLDLYSVLGLVQGTKKSGVLWPFYGNFGLFALFSRSLLRL